MTSRGLLGRKLLLYQVRLSLLFTVSVGYCCAGQLGLPVSREVVLEHIVERKRIDDLAGSIMDGRFREQKVCYLLLVTYHKFIVFFIHIGYSFVCTTVVCDIQST